MTHQSYHEPSLRQVQEWMASCISAPARAALALPRALDLRCLDLPDGVSAGERLQVYAGGYPARVREALAEVYPAVARMLGRDAFEALTDRYAAHVPLTSYNLNDAGADLPEFLRDDPLDARLPFLADLATLEWHVAVAFHARELAPLEPRSLGWSIEDWGSAILHFQPAVAALSSPWPIFDLWGARADAPTGADGDVPPRAAHVVVRRCGLTVHVEAVGADQVRVLRLLRAGQRLGQAIESLTEDGGDSSAVLAWFSDWVAAGMISGATIA